VLEWRNGRHSSVWGLNNGLMPFLQFEEVQKIGKGVGKSKVGGFKKIVSQSNSPSKNGGRELQNATRSGRRARKFL